jgi:hypothetical protein
MMDALLFLLIVLAVFGWWEWKFGIGWTIRTLRRWRGPA